MNTPCRIATDGTGAMDASILVTNLVVQLAGQEFDPVSFATWITLAAPEAVGMGFLAGIGIYFGAPRVALDQRNGRFLKLVTVAYGALGIVLSLPIATHAVRIDMPPAGDASAIQIMPVLLIPVAVASGLVVGSLFLARVLASFATPYSHTR